MNEGVMDSRDKAVTIEDFRPYLEKAQTLAERGASVENVQDLLIPGLRGLITRHVEMHRKGQE
jgi:hypothetical protein